MTALRQRYVKNMIERDAYTGNVMPINETAVLYFLLMMDG